MKKMRKTAVIAAISLLVLSFVTFFSGIKIMRAEKNGTENNKTDEITDVITVKSPIQGSTVTLDNEKIADYFEHYSKGYSVKAGYFGQGDIFMMNPVKFEWECDDGLYYQLYIADNLGFYNAEKFFTTKNYAVIENLVPETKYYWKVKVALSGGEEKTSKSYCFETKGNLRAITLDGVSNSRDLGGIKTADGKVIKYGMVYRSANLDSVTEKGLAEARRLGIRTDLDLRGGDAPTVSPLGSNVNLITKKAPCYTGDPSGINGTEEYRNALRDEIKTFAYEENYPILFHCQIGRDRTGTLAMFILAICGVEKEEILKDYELTYFSYLGTYDGKTECPDWMDYTCDFLGTLSETGTTLSEKAINYAISLGVTETEIASIKRILTR